MRIETYLWIVIGILALLGVIGLILVLQSKEILGKRLLKIAGLSISVTFYSFIVPPRIQRYNLYDEQEFWNRYGLPQIDSCMFLEFHNDAFLSYSSWSKDSILHLKKWIEYDIFDIYSIKDVFINKKESKTLSYYFIKPNILRDSSLIVTINADTISKIEGDLILKDWGIYSRAYFDR